MSANQPEFPGVAYCGESTRPSIISEGLQVIALPHSNPDAPPINESGTDKDSCQ